MSSFMKTTKTYTVDQAKRLLERYCVYQDRCHKEVEQKLSDINMILEAKELILIHLMQHNFLNEERFAKSFVRGKFNQKKWGKIKITNALRFKQISSYNIKTGLKEIEEITYLETIKMLAIKKIAVVNERNHFKKKKKITDYLLQKGFEINYCIEIVNELLSKKT